MSTIQRIEQALNGVLSRAGDPAAPPKLQKALRYAVFPGGARVRPQLCLAVAQANGDDQPALTDAAASSIELLHCASLVHDDLPCFDDAEERRGRPALHRAFGQPLAVLTGDALIVLAFETLARAGLSCPERSGSLLLTMARAAGTPWGLVAGQAWESEPRPELEAYHRGKTGSVFTAATVAGAVAAGADPSAWRPVGERLGQAYQIADDLMDAAGDVESADKPLHRDAAMGRPSAVSELGIEGALARLHTLIGAAVDAIPDCPGASGLEDLVMLQAKRLVPKALSQSAA